VNRATQHANKSYRGVAAALAVVGALALSVGTAHAVDLHKPLFQITEVPTEGPPPLHEPVAQPGPVHEEEGSMTVASGKLWTTGRVSGTQSFRVDEFDATTGAFVSQFAPSSRPRGVAVGKLAGETLPRVYLNEEAAGVRAIGVYSEAGAKLGSWTGAGTPAKSLGFGSVIAVDRSESISDWAAGDVFAAECQVSGKRKRKTAGLMCFARARVRAAKKNMSCS
jgi:hypothetical protein